MAEVTDRLDALVHAVEDAKAMPLSASCVLNRAEFLAALEDLRQFLPRELAAAQAIVDAREDQIAAGRAEAERLVGMARAEQARLVAESELVGRARAEADRIVAEAQARAESMRREVEDYIDGKLANFEVVLSKTISAVSRGREKMRGRSEMVELAEETGSGDGRLRRPALITMDDTGEHARVDALAPTGRTATQRT
jgi:cell division septum initiation protein DivIVA